MKVKAGIALVVLLAASCKPNQAANAAATVEREKIAATDEPLQRIGRQLRVGWGHSTAKDTTRLPTIGLRGTLMLVVDESDCFSCVQLEAEAWEIWRTAERRRMNFQLIGTGRSDSVFVDFMHGRRLPVPWTIDSDAWAATALGAFPHPLLVVLDSAGSVVALMPRNAVADPRGVEKLLASMESIGS